MASQRKRSHGRDSLQSRSSISYARDARSSVGTSASKIPRSTPLMHSSRKILPSASKSVSKKSYFSTADHIKDPRPVNDKSHMRKCINEMIQTLALLGYPNTLTLKSMNPPTNKEYFSIMEFVYRLVSPSYEMICKPDEEAVKILSDLGYPIMVSKNTFTNIGAMSAWPNALAALDWLIDWTTCYKASEEIAEGALFAENKKLPALYDYLKTTYIAFMHGENEPFEDINEALDAKIEAMGSDQTILNKELEAENEALDAKLEALKARKDAISNLELDKSHLETVKQNLSQYFEKLTPYFASLKEKSDATLKHIEDIENSLSQIEKEKSGIECAVSGQELSIADLQNMEFTIGEIEAKIRGTEERTNQAQERLYEKQIQDTKMIDKINSQVAEYMEICQKLEIVPAVGMHNVDVTTNDFCLSSNRADIDKNVGKLLSTIRPKAMEMKSSLLKELGRAQQENMRNVDTLKQLTEEMSDRKRTIENLQKQLDSVQKEEERMRDEFEKKEEKENAEIEELKERIKRQMVVNSLSVDDARENLEIERNRWKETESRTEKKSTETHDSFFRLHEKCMEYKEKMRRMLHDFDISTQSAIQQHLVKMRGYETVMLDQKKQFEQMLKKAKELDEKIAQKLSS